MDSQLFVLLTLLLFSLLALQAQQSYAVLETRNLPTTSSIKLYSNDIKTHLYVESSSDAAASIVIEGVALNTMSYSLSISSENEIIISSRNGNSANSSTSRRASIGALVVSILFSSVVVAASSGRNGSSKLSFALLVTIVAAALVLLQFQASADESTTPTMKLTIKVPTTASMDSILVQIQDGSVNSVAGFSVGSLSIDLCASSASPSAADSSMVSIANLAVGASINVCSKQDVSLANLFLASTRVTTKIVSGRDATISFRGGYAGTFAVQNNGTRTVNGDCQGTTNAQGGYSGKCSNGLYSHAAVQAGRNVNINFASECSSDWKDRAPVDYVPPSPPIQYSIPGDVLDLTNPSNWTYNSEWGKQNAVISAVNGSMYLNTGAWTFATWYLVRSVPLPNLRPVSPDEDASNFIYNLKFSISTVMRTDFKSNITNITVALLRRTDNWYQNILIDNPTVVAWSTNLEGPFNVRNGYVDKEVTISLAAPLSGAYVALRVQTVSGADSKPNEFYVKNLKFTIPDRKIRIPTSLITSSSVLASQRKPSPSLLDTNPRTNCPHDRAGLKLWHDPATWPNNVVPSPGQTITLPTGSAVLVTACSLDRNAVYERIVVPETSELIFADAPISFKVKSIFVDGHLWMGSPTCRLYSPINVVFHGKKSSMENSQFGSKGLGISSKGQLDIHGKLYHHTWTRIAYPIGAGDNIAYLQDEVNWEVGQKVVVATSIREDELNPQNEVMTIKAINGKTVQFEEKFKFAHFASSEYQVEVGLLSRRITFTGNSDQDYASDADKDSEAYGGHVMVMGQGRVQGLALVRMGQKNVLARYPMHFHMVGNAVTSYFKDSTIYKSYYRCVSIHGTHNTTVERNVAFDAHGHCYYLEDGVEEGNTLAYNLAVYVHPIGTPAAGGGQGGDTVKESANLRLPADITASGFYITNAYNRIIGNAASGGWSGFSFPNLPKPIGLHQPSINSKYANFDPSGRTTLEFDGNTAHSSGYFWWAGSCVYTGGLLTVDTDGLLLYNSGRNSRATRAQIPNESYTWQSPELFMRFTNLKTFLCQDGIGHWGDRIEVVNYEAHDVHRGATLFGEALLQNAIITGRTSNPAEMPSTQGFQFYDTWVKSLLANVTFRNYQPRANPSSVQDDNRCIISMTHSDTFKPQGISAVKAIRYENVKRSQIIGHRIQDTGSSKYYNFIDWDGSATLRPSARVVGSHSPWWKLGDDCEFEADWQVWVCQKTPQREIANVGVVIPGLISSETFEQTIVIGKTCLFGSSFSDERCTDLTRNPGVTGATGVNWFMYVNDGSPKSFQLQLNQIPFGTSILFAVKYPPNTSFNVTASYQYNKRYDATFSKAASVSAVASGDGKNYFFDGTFLYLKLVNPMFTGAASDYFERAGVKIYDIMLGYSYFISSSCSANANGNCPVTFSLPTTP